ncbi:unnamed protein product [Tuber melanosporum]|uniref:(Perigord truffle) hypothetical protein n=1 Tax=Tuber melanosporum (strain Mel28) TaxID=656061 RepID=D5G3W0_TUBMM|nr:uncharacterized protein GSTUM_00003824001 [Tuber melanosporum]CAZ79203.1 unnamed protein product [Tuber melanosporum]
MGIAKKTRKFAQVKRVISSRDTRLKKNQAKQQTAITKKDKSGEVVREIPQVSSSLFFQFNTALRPPYSVLVDTNFLNFTIQKKLEVMQSMMDCLRYRIALRIARDPRFERARCDHKGTYADDCIVNRVLQHKIYIVATNDRDLKRRVRKIPGVPIMSCGNGKYVIERLPDAPEK